MSADYDLPAVRAAMCVMILPAACLAQEETLDLLDGETLYQGGWLLTLNYQIERKERLFRGDGPISDSLGQRQTEHTTALAAHYGLRYDLQLSAIMPYVYRELKLSDPSGPDRLEADGPGDFVALTKWRFYRWDAPGKALNLAVLGGIEFPTGSDHERDGGGRVPPEIQPGSGSWDPMAGVAATYEPRRWRFNTFVLYKKNTENGHDYRFGDEVFAEVAIGNRFWLEPYPGPFMRADLSLRYRREGHDHLGSRSLRNTGGDLLTVGLNLAFRPRPSLDFQTMVELPVYERVNGMQLAEAYSVTFSFGYRF